MKNILNKQITSKFLMAGILMASLSACGSSSLPPLEEGVSKELASWRKDYITDVRYELFFDIPAQKDSSVKCRESIIFTDASKQIPPIDFRSEEDKITSVKIDGMPADYCFDKEHICIQNTVSKGKTVKIELEFTARDQSLNRRDELLYTLLVPDRARTLFPCFDQPDLKSRYSLSLALPEGWTAVSNTKLLKKDAGGVLHFAQSEPLSTYLFSFAAGEFESVTQTRGERSITMYHRENDPAKLAQIPAIFDEFFASMEWMEAYTAIPYPFGKYDFVVLPGFQYGGMEHTGDSFFNDGRIFLEEGAGTVRKMVRSKLIAHEVAHLWFGDYVTMKWFDDVWTKEVFANWFASGMMGDWYPDEDNSMEFVTLAKDAYEVDRTAGSNAVKRPLDNLSNAGLIYGNIIYDKSPVIMEMLSEFVGKEKFRLAMQEYLTRYAYGNADWNDLIAILDENCDMNLEEFSRVWVNENGMPGIEVKDGSLVQFDRLGRGLLWPQQVCCAVVRKGGLKDAERVKVFLEGAQASVADADASTLVIPNIDGRSYGFFKLSGKALGFCEKMLLSEESSQLEKSVLLAHLYENVRQGDWNADRLSLFLLSYLGLEKDQQLFSQALSYLGTLQRMATFENGTGIHGFDEALKSIVTDPTLPESSRRSAFKLWCCKSMSKLDETYTWFVNPALFKAFRLSEDELTTLALELAIRRPEMAENIISLQVSRIDNKDRLERFMFISRAVSPDKSELDALFESFKQAENRRIEPWTASALSYLNHPFRASRSEKYLIPGLDILPQVQRSGDIFFPSSWLAALLSGHGGSEIKALIDEYFARNPEYPQMLKEKVYQNVLCD